MKILIAEDEKFLLQALTTKLRSEGFQVLQARTGQETLDILRGERPSLVLLDLIMPHKNGFEVLEEMKKDPNLSSIPVIIISNLGQHEDIEKGKALGAIDYIVKADYSLSDIVKKVKNVLHA